MLPQTHSHVFLKKHPTSLFFSEKKTGNEGTWPSSNASSLHLTAATSSKAPHKVPGKSRIRTGGIRRFGGLGTCTGLFDFFSKDCFYTTSFRLLTFRASFYCICFPKSTSEWTVFEWYLHSLFPNQPPINPCLEPYHERDSSYQACFHLPLTSVF